jgi:hypothetical protein
MKLKTVMPAIHLLMPTMHMDAAAHVLQMCPSAAPVMLLTVVNTFSCPVFAAFHSLLLSAAESAPSTV